MKNEVLGGVILCLLAAIVLVDPSNVAVIACAIGVALVIFGTVFFVLLRRDPAALRPGASWVSLLSMSLIVLVLPASFAVILYYFASLTFFSWFFLVGLSIVFYVNALMVPLAVYHYRHEARSDGSTSYLPPVTILIPAYNEETVLRRTIEAVLETTYAYKEVIVIDDGSTDRTLQIAQGFRDRGVMVIHRPNGGKATALNHGLRFARGEIIVIVDADSLMGKNTLLELVQPFKDERVAAVAGNIKVLNRINWLTKCQALEYITSINLNRRAMDMFGSVTVVPGALGAYRREILQGSGIYDPDTLVEDFDVTMKILKTGQVVKASTTATAYTEAPETLGELIKQRLRWNRGNFQALWKHRDAAVNSRFGFLQKLSFPYLFISMTFVPVAGMVTIIAAILSILNGGGLTLLSAVVFFISLQYLTSLLAIRLEGEDQQLSLFAPLLVIGYKQFCDYIVLRSLFDVLFRKKLRWASVHRTGTEVSRSALS